MLSESGIEGSSFLIRSRASSIALSQAFFHFATRLCLILYRQYTYNVLVTKPTNYRELLVEALEKFGILSRQREEIEAEIIKLRQFIYAAVNMLSDSERPYFDSALVELTAENGGLTDAVREALKLATQRKTHFTAAQVRDQLVMAGFDFSQYSSNPLASVNTTIKRLKPSDVESITVDGVAAYCWIFRFPRLDPEEERRRKVGAGRLGASKLPR